uniref:Uncharacterized protein n=1 Tax=Ditylenchus dipsaci TaxID=166011 RepID=A0A915DIX9_9BILA
MLKLLPLICLAFVGANAVAPQKRDTSVLMKDQFADFGKTASREVHYMAASAHATEKCKKPVEVQTAENKKALNEQITRKYANFRDNCFPRGSGSGCRCSTTNSLGQEETISFDTDDKCNKRWRSRLLKTRKQLTRSSSRNMADSRRIASLDLAKAVDATKKTQLVRRWKCVMRLMPTARCVNPGECVVKVRRSQSEPVINELKDKFRGLKEGCYPRPKGCLCVIGKNSEGRDITQRRLKDSDCKCQPNERSRDCPAPAA